MNSRREDIDHLEKPVRYERGERWRKRVGKKKKLRNSEIVGEKGKLAEVSWKIGWSISYERGKWREAGSDASRRTTKDQYRGGAAGRTISGGEVESSEPK